MNNLVPVNINIPAHLTNRVNKTSALAEALSGGLSSSGNIAPRISIKGSRFRIVENGAEAVLDSTTLDVIIVGANPRLSKTWYATAWDNDTEPSSPDCFSLDGVRPHPDSLTPQNDLCASCPHNAWGSKITPNGQRVKACADTKRLAVVASNYPTGPIYLLVVTPASLRGLNQYQKELTVRGIPVEVVKTRVSFDTDASFPKLKFSFGGFMDADTQEVVDKLFGSDRVKEITGELQKGGVSENTKPVQVEKPQPVVVKKATEEVTEEAAPAAKRGFMAQPTASKETEPVAKRGFAAQPAISKEAEPVAKRGLAAQPSKPKPTQATSDAAMVSSLADEIAALLSGETDD